MNTRDLTPVGVWTADTDSPAFTGTDLARSIARVREPVHVVRDGHRGAVGVALGGHLDVGGQDRSATSYPLLATLPALYPEWLGDRSFAEVHGVRFPYVAGAMANGIASAEMVIAMAREQLLAFFGAAGLALAEIRQGLDQIQAATRHGCTPWGANLIHSPNEPELEQQTAALYIERGVTRVSASAYMSLTPALVQYACSGLRADSAGRIRRRHHLFAKISRPEVARLFLAPAPAAMLRQLVDQGRLTRQEAQLAARIPLAGDITVEGDSGGHTDNRPLTVLLPAIQSLRDELVSQLPQPCHIRVGAAGGLGTPSAVAAAFALGAAYVLTGSVNQAACESALSPAGKAMLAGASLADVAMAPSPDMFEMGVKVQVLKRGTLFAARAALLHQVYSGHASLEELTPRLRARLEKEVFQGSLDQVWNETRSFFEQRNPAELERAAGDPKHRMALLFRWYLGKSSRWAIAGEQGRELDYQIWCGPAMGAFNSWTRGSFLDDPQRRTVVQIALNLLEGAAVVTRAHQLRCYGVPVPTEAFLFRPRPLR